MTKLLRLIGMAALFCCLFNLVCYADRLIGPPSPEYFIYTDLIKSQPIVDKPILILDTAAIPEGLDSLQFNWGVPRSK